jgi:transcription antitermination protein NusB
MGSRRLARETALQMLYLCDNCGFTPEEAEVICFTELKPPPTSHDFADELFKGTWTMKKKLDGIIGEHAENWEMDRMAVIDRNILRFAAFEIMDMIETPINVIIDEAVEIAKKFSTIDSGKFVNGILDKLKTIRKETQH